MEKLIDAHYRLAIKNISRILTGVGGQTYLLETDTGKYILKGFSSRDVYVQNEPDIVEYLSEKEIPVAEYIKDKSGKSIWRDGETAYHMQRYVEGEVLPFNEAPDWFMVESAETLGRIHSALAGFKRLPVGMGEGFLGFMKSDRPQNAYRQTLEKAKCRNDEITVTDVEYRLSQIGRLRDVDFDLTKFTCCNTHGDYKISQIICATDRIAAIIDWSAACVHPICWEIIRSFTYADPHSREGKIDTGRFVGYVKTYLRYHTLNEYDLKMMPYFFWCQLLACDYYGQYYSSTDANREDFLFQARLATGLIRWFEHNVSDLSKQLLAI